MSRSTLTERYVWAVARHLPEEIGPDVAEELRSSLAETIEAKIDAGAAPQEAEREAITELGDPDVLARGYGGMPNHLIGPAVYPDFIRLLKILMVAVPSIVFVVSATVNAMTGDTHPGTIALDAALLAFTVAVHVGFWTGLTFALVERSRPEHERDRPLIRWDPSLLTTDVPWRDYPTPQMVSQVLWTGAVAVVMTWQFAGVGQQGLQVLNPSLPLVWEVLVVGLITVEVVLAFLAWRTGRWTPTLAALAVVANVAGAVVTLWLLGRGDLLTDLQATVGQRFDLVLDQSVAIILFGAGVVLVTAWDATDAVLRARRSLRGPGRSGLPRRTKGDAEHPPSPHSS